MNIHLNRPEQELLARKMVAILYKEFGRKAFKPDYQGPKEGSICTLVLKGNDFAEMQNIRTYLHKPLMVHYEKILNHGSIKTTIKIQISELDSDEVNVVEAMHEGLFPNAKCYKVEIKTETPVEIKAVEHRKAMSQLTKFRSGISSFITNIFEFENKFLPESKKRDVKNLFNFCKERDESLQTVICKDEETAIRIESALQWLIDGNNPNIICRTKAEIVVIYSELPTNLSRNHPGINFRFPPSRGAGSAEIGIRILGVKSTPSPFDIYAVNSTDTFLVTYARKSSAHKILILLKDMGWNVWITTEEDLMVCTLPCTNGDQSSSTEPIVSEFANVEDNVPSISEIEIVHHADPKYLIVPGLAHEETVGNILCVVHSKDDAFIELNQLYLNDSLFSKLSSEMQDEIKRTLKRIFQEEKTEEYAQMLLDTLNNKK